MGIVVLGFVGGRSVGAVALRAPAAADLGGLGSAPTPLMYFIAASRSD